MTSIFIQLFHGGRQTCCILQLKVQPKVELGSARKADPISTLSQNAKSAMVNPGGPVAIRDLGCYPVFWFMEKILQCSGSSKANLLDVFS